MKINVQGLGIQISDDIQSRVEQKLSRFNRYFGDEAHAMVKVLPEGNQVKVEVNIKIPRQFFRSETVSADVRTALDQSVEVLERQIRKHRTRLERQTHSAGLKELLQEVEPMDEAEDDEPQIRHKQFELDAMSPEEATLQMELISHDFYLFKHSDTGQVNLVYKRRDGSYGWIEPV